MKKFICLTIALIICFATAGIAQATPFIIFLDGSELTFDAPPIIENGRTLVPVRTIFEALGAAVDWDENTKTVTATKDNTEIKLVIGGQAYKNNQLINLDVPAKIYNNRTLVPLRFISEAFGASVAWDDYNQIITIKTTSLDLGSLTESIPPSDITEPVYSNTNEIFDTLTGPLSKNWDMKRSGDWAVDNVYGAYPSANYTDQPLVLKNTVIPDLNNKNYTMEVEMILQEGRNWDAAGGGFLINATPDYYPVMNTITFRREDFMESDGIWVGWDKISNYEFDFNNYYKLKVDVNSDTDTVDIYLDDEYFTSKTIKNKGNMIGLWAKYPNGKENFKNFRLTLNE